MPPSAPDPEAVAAPTARAAYPLWTSDKLRYRDTDRQGHVNNAVFATFCESGRATFLYDPAAPLAPAGTQFVIARLIVDYRTELNWPGSVDIGTAVARLGNRSFTMVHGVFQGEVCASTGISVMVLMDETTRRATTLPDALRARLGAVMVRSIPPDTIGGG